MRREYLSATNAKKSDPVIVDSLLQEMRRIDGINISKVTDILEVKGWPANETVGSDAANAVFVVLQHASPEVQTRYLPEVRAAAERGDLPLSNLALYEDRVAVGMGELQTYGTQITYDGEGNPVLAPLAHPQNVNSRRKEVGLGPIEEYLRNWDLEFSY